MKQPSLYKELYSLTSKTNTMNTKTYLLSFLAVFLFGNAFAECPTPTTTPSGSVQLCGGGSSQLLSASSGDSYQWYKDGTAIEGATDQDYTAIRSGAYSVDVASEGCSTQSSEVVTITKTPFPKIFISADGDNVICEGESVELTAETYDVENAQYQWLRGGIAIEGATNASYLAEQGGKFRVTVTNTEAGCSRTSGASNIILMKVKAIIIPLGNTEICPGNGVDLMVVDNAGFGAEYQWTRYNNDIPGASDFLYTATLDGHYRVNVTSSLGCAGTAHFVKVTYGPCRMEGDENVSANISSYPNPTNGMLYINNASDAISLEMFNTLGQKVLTSFETDRVNLSNLPKGFYIIKLYDVNHEVKSLLKIQKV